MTKIENFKKVNAGKIKAFFSVNFGEKLIVYDFKLIQNDKGELWVASPSRQYQDGNEKKWSPTARILDEAILDKITILARQAYNGNTPREEDVPF